MTAEEILTQKWKEKYGDDKKYPLEWVVHNRELVESAMNEYAEQQSKEFLDWTMKNNWYLNENDSWDRDGNVFPDSQAYSTTELYQLFKEANH